MITHPMTFFDSDAVSELVESWRALGVHALVGTFVDNSGVVRAKQVPLERVEAFHRSGLGASYSWANFCIDDALPLTEYFSVVGDMRMKADLGAARVLGDGLAWAPVCLYDQENQPLAHCPRGTLRRQVDLLASANVTGRSAFEIEFTAFDASSGEVGTGVAYGLRAMMDNEAFFADILRSLAVAGIAVEQLHAEAGRGQIELSTPPLDPVAAADVLVATRLILCRVARRHGKRLSFAPQSLVEGIGNGAHVHFSRLRDGQPLFSGGDGPRGLTPAGASAIGCTNCPTHSAFSRRRCCRPRGCRPASGPERSSAGVSRTGRPPFVSARQPLVIRTAPTLRSKSLTTPPTPTRPSPWCSDLPTTASPRTPPSPTKRPRTPTPRWAHQRPSPPSTPIKHGTSRPHWSAP